MIMMMMMTWIIHISFLFSPWTWCHDQFSTTIGSSRCIIKTMGHSLNVCTNHHPCINIGHLYPLRQPAPHRNGPIEAEGPHALTVEANGPHALIMEAKGCHKLTTDVVRALTSAGPSCCCCCCCCYFLACLVQAQASSHLRCVAFELPSAASTTEITRVLTWFLGASAEDRGWVGGWGGGGGAGLSKSRGVKCWPAQCPDSMPEGPPVCLPACPLLPGALTPCPKVHPYAFLPVRYYLPTLLSLSSIISQGSPVLEVAVAAVAVNGDGSSGSSSEWSHDSSGSSSRWRHGSSGCSSGWMDRGTAVAAVDGRQLRQQQQWRCSPPWVGDSDTRSPQSGVPHTMSLPHPRTHTHPPPPTASLWPHPCPFPPPPCSAPHWPHVQVIPALPGQPD